MLIPTLISGFVGCTAAAAISDVLELRVPNRLCLVIVALFAVYALAALDVRQAGLAFAIGAATLAMGFVFFTRGWLGGGDAKLLAAAALWAGPLHILDLLAVTAIAGGAMALVLQSPYAAPLTDSLQQRWQRCAPEGQRAPMPYAVAIAAGALFVAAQLLGV